MNTIIKTFKNRSSATDVLRQLGVPTRDYNIFIEPTDGGVACNITLAKQHVMTLAEQTGADKIGKAATAAVKTVVDAVTEAAGEALAVATSGEPLMPAMKWPNQLAAPDLKKKGDKKAAAKKVVAKAEPVPASRKPEKRTVSSVARALIIDGKSNEEVWDALVKEFRLDDTKKSYPAWYRRECVKKGLIAE